MRNWRIIQLWNVSNRWQYENRWYQSSSKKAYGLYLAGKRCICLYLHLKKLAPGGIWTHTVRAGEGATTLRVSIASPIKKKYWNIHLQKLGPGGNWTHTDRADKGTTTLRVLSPLPSNPSLVASMVTVAAVWLEKYWLDSWMKKKLESGGIWTRARGIPRKLHYIMRNYVYTKYTKFHVGTADHRITDTEKVLKYTFTKPGTWWELNTHCSGGRRYSHITREHCITDKEKVLKYTLTKTGDLVGIEHTLIGRTKGTTTLRVLSPLPSTPSLVASMVTVAAVWLEKYWLDSWMEKIGIGWDLNTRSWNTAKATLHYA